jgi:hypothetical protein
MNTVGYARQSVANGGDSLEAQAETIAAWCESKRQGWLIGSSASNSHELRRVGDDVQERNRAEDETDHQAPGRAGSRAESSALGLRASLHVRDALPVLPDDVNVGVVGPLGDRLREVVQEHQP